MPISDERAMKLFEDIGGLKSGVAQIIKTLDEEAEERTQLNTKLDDTLTNLGHRVTKLETEQAQVKWFARGIAFVLSSMAVAFTWIVDHLQAPFNWK